MVSTLRSARLRPLVLFLAWSLALLCPATFVPAAAAQGIDGASDRPALIFGKDGNLYGTSIRGGVNGEGAVFKVTPTGVLTLLHSFDGTDGSRPVAGLTKGKDGNFYGVTYTGGTYDYGTAFKITPAGALTTLHVFAKTDGAFPWASLTSAPDGDLYGVTSTGGAYSGSDGLGYGTIFKITMAGTLTTLHNFTGTDGETSYAGLTRDKVGNLYGNTYEGGAYGYGTVFKFTPRGKLITLHSFNMTDGAWPQADLLLANDGNLYSTTSHGGAYSGPDGHGYGTIFQITPTGTLTTLYSFNGPDGANPLAGLTLGRHNVLYSTTYHGGANSSPGELGDGTVFQISATGGLKTIFSFDAAAGENPYAPLTLASDGNLYGQTAMGGANNKGTVFKVTPQGQVVTLCSL
jgi:uncharacterized repeat protein (TIGR03803 family)